MVIKKTVTIYLCSYCRLAHRTLSVCVNHESFCNPKADKADEDEEIKVVDDAIEIVNQQTFEGIASGSESPKRAAPFTIVPTTTAAQMKNESQESEFTGAPTSKKRRTEPLILNKKQAADEENDVIVDDDDYEDPPVDSDSDEEPIMTVLAMSCRRQQRPFVTAAKRFNPSRGEEMCCAVCKTWMKREDFVSHVGRGKTFTSKTKKQVFGRGRGRPKKETTRKVEV